MQAPKKIILILLIEINLISCSSVGSIDNEASDFFNRYQNETFCKLNNFSISERDRTLSKIIYLVNEFSYDTPPYVVEYSLIRRSIVSIDNKLLMQNGSSDYFSREEIQEITQAIRKYKFYLLEIDSLGSVFINPYESNSPAVYLRLYKNSELSEVFYKHKYVKEMGVWYKIQN